MGSTGDQWITTYPDIQTELPTGPGSPSYTLAMNFRNRYSPPTRATIQLAEQTFYQVQANAQDIPDQQDPGTNTGN